MTARQPSLLSGLLLKAFRPVEAVIGPVVPTVSEPSNSYVRENSGWKRGMNRYLER